MRVLEPDSNVATKQFETMLSLGRLLILSMLTPADDTLNVPGLDMVSVVTVEVLAATRLTPLCVVLEFSLCVTAVHVDSPTQHWQLDIVAEPFVYFRCDIWKKFKRLQYHCSHFNATMFYNL